MEITYNNITDKILKEKIIVVLRGIEKNKLLKLATALYNGGIRLMEVTFSQDGKVTDEETADMISMLSSEFDGKAFIGAGTVLTTKQVELAHKAGAKYIISPDTVEEIICKTKELGLVSIPGAFTPTEVNNAHRAGADFVKIFPAGILGPEYIKAIKAPLSGVKLLAVGGVTLDNISKFIDSGAVGFGLSACIVNQKMVDEEDYGGITNLAKKYVDALKNN